MNKFAKRNKLEEGEAHVMAKGVTARGNTRDALASGLYDRKLLCAAVAARVKLVVREAGKAARCRNCPIRTDRTIPQTDSVNNCLRHNVCSLHIKWV